MKCPYCEVQDKKSTVSVVGNSTTLMHTIPYYDEVGQYHYHDSNRYTIFLKCSNGHEWSDINTSGCPSCGYGHENDK